MKWGSDGTVSWNETPVEICRAQKSLEPFLVLRSRPGLDCLHFPWVYFDVSSGQNELQKGHKGGVELQLLRLNKELIVKAAGVLPECAECAEFQNGRKSGCCLSRWSHICSSCLPKYHWPSPETQWGDRGLNNKTESLQCDHDTGSDSIQFSYIEPSTVFIFTLWISICFSMWIL